MLMANSHANADTETQVIDDLISRQVDGLLLASVDARSTRLANLRRSRPPPP